MLERLQKDPALARYAGWFIPLKLETNGEEYRKWRSRYRHEGNAIPILFVVRADGQQLYGKSGPLPGPQLPLMLEQTLAQAGTIYNDQQLQTLSLALEKAKQAVSNGDKATATTELAKVGKLGSPGELGSFAEVATAIDGLAQELIKEGRQSLANAKEQLGVEATRFEGALALMETRRVYLPLPALREEIAAAVSQYRSQDDFREMLKQAEQLDEARGLLGKPAGRTRALGMLRRFATTHAGTPAASVANQWIGEYSDEAASTSADEPSGTEPAKFHTWTSDSGHATEAVLVGYGYTEETKLPYVVLQTHEGNPVNVLFSRLSESSQELAQQLVRQMREDEAKE